jgi:hypothetical protein
MKKLFLFSIMSLGLFSSAICQNSDTTITGSEEKLVPDTVKLGVFFTSIYDLNLAEKSFTADFWIWYNYKNDSINPLESIEISNAKEFEFQSEDIEKVGMVNWATHKCKATVKKEWNLKNFPFDKQELHVEIEDAMYDIDQLVYVADVANSKFDKNIKLDEWKIRSFSVEQMRKEYETTYGNPELHGTSTYPGLVASFVLERDGVGLFFKLFVGIFVAYLISLSVFFMGPENPERFGMIVGALFAGVANKYIVESLMPQTIMLTLPDKIHNLTFIYIIFHLIITVFAFRLSVKERLKLGWRIDIICFLFSIISYIAINFYWVSEAIKHTR